MNLHKVSVRRGRSIYQNQDDKKLYVVDAVTVEESVDVSKLSLLTPDDIVDMLVDELIPAEANRLMRMAQASNQYPPDAKINYYLFS